MPKELTELEAEQLEAVRLQNELARMQLTQLRAEVEMKTSNKKRGQVDAQKAIDDDKAVKARCNHHTGGKGAEAVLWGQGDEDRPFCIGAQVFLDDSIRLVCGRCRDSVRSDDPDRAKWAKWVGMWKKSINQEMMVIGGLKIGKRPEVAA